MTKHGEDRLWRLGGGAWHIGTIGELGGDWYKPSVNMGKAGEIGCRVSKPLCIIGIGGVKPLLS